MLRRWELRRFLCAAKARIALRSRLAAFVWRIITDVDVNEPNEVFGYSLVKFPMRFAAATV